MKISLNWLKKFIKIESGSEEIAALLTNLGLEVETVEKYQSVKGGLEGVLVGHILSCIPHPEADRLKLTIVDLGTGVPVQIVCGAKNVASGLNVPVATIGTTLYNNDGVETIIKKGKIRGQESFGMICAEDELGIGTDHEGIMVLDPAIVPGTKMADVLKIVNDEVFEIGLTPNRADAMSHLGTARDLRAGLLQSGINVELITPSISNFRVDMRTLKIDVLIENPELAPRYCGLTISGITVKPSPNWLQNNLRAIGLQPKNNIIDVTNYVLHELGQPLHAFDASKIKGQIIVKTAVSGTKFTTLDGVERILHEDDLMIYDETKPLCIAGIFGGVNSGISQTTKTIFLESAYFSPVNIRKTSKRHQLNTDASFRFERGIDPNITAYALKRAALLIQEVAGGEITSDVSDFYPKKIEDFSVFLNFGNVTKIIGQEIPKDTIKQILASLDLKITTVSETGLGLTIPPYRVDVQREIDVIEEILRIYGYNNIKFSKKFNASVSNSPRNEDYKIQNIIATQLNSKGFHEMMSNSLTTNTYVELSKMLKSEYNVSILNPLSTDLSTLRQSLLFSGLESMSFNINRKNSDLKLFEFGKTYHKYLSGFEEHKHLTLFQTGKINQENWVNPPKETDFFLFKGYVEAILNRLGVQKLQNSPLTTDVFSEGMVISMGHNSLVEFGVLKKSISKHFGIKQDVFFADFNWDLILKAISNKIKFVEISKYPEVRRDLAILIDKNISYDTILKLANKSEKLILKSINLFDVYEGGKLPEGKKSYALSFILGGESKTLTDSEIDTVMKKLQRKFEVELGARLR